MHVVLAALATPSVPACMPRTLGTGAGRSARRPEGAGGRRRRARRAAGRGAGRSQSFDRGPRRGCGTTAGDRGRHQLARGVPRGRSGRRRRGDPIRARPPAAGAAAGRPRQLLSDPGIPGLGALAAHRASATLSWSAGYWERAGLLRAGALERRRKARIADALIAQSCLDRRCRWCEPRQGLLRFPPARRSRRRCEAKRQRPAALVDFQRPFGRGIRRSSGTPVIRGPVSFYRRARRSGEKQFCFPVLLAVASVANRHGCDSQRPLARGSGCSQRHTGLFGGPVSFNRRPGGPEDYFFLLNSWPSCKGSLAIENPSAAEYTLAAGQVTGRPGRRFGNPAIISLHAHHRTPRSLSNALAWQDAHVTFDDVVAGIPAEARGRSLPACRIPPGSSSSISASRSGTSSTSASTPTTRKRSGRTTTGRPRRRRRRPRRGTDRSARSPRIARRSRRWRPIPASTSRRRSRTAAARPISESLAPVIDHSAYHVGQAGAGAAAARGLERVTLIWARQHPERHFAGRTIAAGRDVDDQAIGASIRVRRQRHLIDRTARPGEPHLRAAGARNTIGSRSFLNSRVSILIAASPLPVARIGSCATAGSSPGTPGSAAAPAAGRS